MECRGWTHDHLVSIGQPYQLSYIHLGNVSVSLSLLSLSLPLCLEDHSKHCCFLLYKFSSLFELWLFCLMHSMQFQMGILGGSPPPYIILPLVSSMYIIMIPPHWFDHFFLPLFHSIDEFLLWESLLKEALNFDSFFKNDFANNFKPYETFREIVNNLMDIVRVLHFLCFIWLRCIRCQSIWVHYLLASTSRGPRVAHLWLRHQKCCIPHPFQALLWWLLRCPNSTTPLEKWNKVIKLLKMQAKSHCDLIMI